MKDKRWSSVVLMLTVATSPARAAVFERDWKMPGDGLLTYDDVNQREWLDLSETQLHLFSGADSNAKLQSALLEIAPGGLYEGFTFATRDDVMAFAQSAGINTSSFDFTINHSATSSVITLLSPTLVNVDGSKWSTGFINEFSTNPNRPGRLVAMFALEPPNFAGTAFSDTNDFTRRTSNGILLYRHAVPEPGTFVSGVFILSCLVLQREFRLVC